jgi:hypothetical protein
MAFVSFTCEVAAGGERGEPPKTPPHVIAADDNEVE